MQVVSRAIGVHELQLDNFYPFVMRYLKPSQRDVVAVLAAVVQACHRLVSPEAVRPVLLQLVDQFVHDKARPEVGTIPSGLACSLIGIPFASGFPCLGPLHQKVHLADPKSTQPGPPLGWGWGCYAGLH